MIQTFPNPRTSIHSDQYQRRVWLVQTLWRLVYLGIILLAARHLIANGVQVATIAWIIYWAGAVLIIVHPRSALYMMPALTLFGDIAMLPWYPFTKNFSSYESILFLHGAAIVTPLETYLALAMLSWLIRKLFSRDKSWQFGALFWPIAVFVGFITVGLVYGISRGGDLTIALWETRSIYYIPLIYVLMVNLLHTRAQINIVIWSVIIGIGLKACAGLWHVATVLEFDLGLVERIAEHSGSIHFDALIVLTLAVWIYRASSAKRFVLTLTLPIVLFSLFANQRRSSFLTLAVALALVALVLFRERRTLFYIIVPALAAIFAVYVLAFWGSTAPIAMPARAIRSVVDSSGGNARDQASNLYRIYENINTMATIKYAPLTGVGFGNKFFIVVSMADISGFVWWEYITHNSVLYIWMKAGAGAFGSMIFLLSYALHLGMRTVWRLPPDDMAAAGLMATLYIFMHFMFAYVDMSWFGNNMFFVGLCLGLIAILERVVATAPPAPPLRWPWQTPTPPPPGLRLSE